MAWTSQGEEVLATLTWYVALLKLREEAELDHAYDKAVNPFLGEWESLKEITIVNLQVEIIYGIPLEYLC